MIDIGQGKQSVCLSELSEWKIGYAMGVLKSLKPEPHY